MANHTLSHLFDRWLRGLRFWFRHDWQEAGRGIKRALACAAVAMLHTLVFTTLSGQRLERELLHQWFALRGEREVPQSITIVRLDSPSYKKLGLLPADKFPRRLMAKGVEKIAQAGAKLIILDVFAMGEGEDPEANEMLAKALAGSTSVIGRYTEEILYTKPDGSKRRKKLSNKPLPLFEQHAKAVVPLQVRVQDGVVEEICLSNDYVFSSDVRLPLLKPLQEFVSPDVQEPGGFDFINFYGPAGSLVNMSFSELLEPDSDERLGEYLKDRIVFVGVCTDAGVSISAGKDTFLTSVSRSPMYGVEIHATIAANLLDRSWIRRLPAQTEVGMLAVVAFVITFFSVSFSLLPGALTATAGACAWLWFSYYSFVHAFRFIPGATLALVLVLCLIIGRWGIEGMMNAGLRKMFSHFAKPGK